GAPGDRRLPAHRCRLPGARVLYLTTQAQEATPRPRRPPSLDYQGRVHSTFTTVMAASSLLVYGVVGALSDVVSLRWLYWAQAVVLLAGVAVAHRVVRRSGLRKTVGARLASPGAEPANAALARSSTPTR
ncbi:MAG TPA: hypothetical protein VKP11_10015, partial [Frankiaceae bacterium]|nr:hypothetical protein [Frankiaceae bacterium]